MDSKTHPAGNRVSRWDLSPGELRRLLERAGLKPEAGSPLLRELSSADQPSQPPLKLTPELRAALELLAGPDAAVGVLYTAADSLQFRWFYSRASGPALVGHHTGDGMHRIFWPEDSQEIVRSLDRSVRLDLPARWTAATLDLTCDEFMALAAVTDVVQASGADRRFDPEALWERARQNLSEPGLQSMVQRIGLLSPFALCFSREGLAKGCRGLSAKGLLAGDGPPWTAGRAWRTRFLEWAAPKGFCSIASNRKRNGTWVSDSLALVRAGEALWLIQFETGVDRVTRVAMGEVSPDMARARLDSAMGCIRAKQAPAAGPPPLPAQYKAQYLSKPAALPKSPDVARAIGWRPAKRLWIGLAAAVVLLAGAAAAVFWMIPEPDPIRGLYFYSNGEHLGAIRSSGRAAAWDWRNNRLVMRADTGVPLAGSCAFFRSPGEPRAATVVAVSRPGSVVLGFCGEGPDSGGALADAAELRSGSDQVDHLQFTVDGKILFGIGLASNRSYHWSLFDPGHVREYPLPLLDARAVAVTPDNRFLAAVTGRGEVVVVELQTQRLCLTRPSPLAAGRPVCLAFSRFARYIAVAEPGASSIAVLDLMNNGDWKTIDGGAEVSALAFSPDQRFLAAGGPKQLAVWDADSGARIKAIDLP